MITLSQLVDEMCLEFLRPDLNALIASEINHTIREVHTGKDGVIYRFNENREEFRIQIAAEDYSGGIFKYPFENPSWFQSVEAILYEESNRYAIEAKPGKIHPADWQDPSAQYIYYHAGPFIHMKGTGGVGQYVRLSAFYYPRRLIYYADNTKRWAEVNPESGLWSYNADNSIENIEKKDRSTNWILMRHGDMVREGVRAKVFKRLGDVNRAQLAYSSYMDARQAMQIQESVQQLSTVTR